VCDAADMAYNRAISPPGQVKQPLLYLPPPPQHPPPSSGIDCPPPQRHLSTDDTCDDEDIYSKIPASSSEAGDIYPPSLPLVDYYAGHSAGYDVVDDDIEDSLPPRRPPRAPTSKMVSASPQLQRRLGDQVNHGTTLCWPWACRNRPDPLLISVLGSGAMGRVLDLRSTGRGFNSYSGQSCITTLGKLFTPISLCHEAV